jgi:ribosomal protein S18 acetylase RimI-like enzyme
MKKIQEITALDTFSVRHPILRDGKPIEDCHFKGDNLPSTKHFGLFIDEKLIGVISVFKNKSVIFNFENQYQIRGMAVLTEFQKKGFGQELVVHCEAFIKEEKGELIWFNARENAVDFYKKLNYKIVGTIFDIPSVGLHYTMKKEIG